MSVKNLTLVLAVLSATTSAASEIMLEIVCENTLAI